MSTDAGSVRVASLEELRERGCVVTREGSRPVAVFHHEGAVRAVDNRCPHMGFPLDRGSLADGILTCHWHHARFDLGSGGCFDPWAGDVETFPCEVRDGEVYCEVPGDEPEAADPHARLTEGLERSISLLLAKAAITLEARDEDPDRAFRRGLDFGVRHRRDGWSSGLTQHVCFRNLLPRLETADRPKAVYHGLAAVASDAAGEAPRIPDRPLPGASGDPETLGRWFRRFIEVRDADGAGRCLASAVARSGGSPEGRTRVAGMLAAAATDHRFIDGGHTLDFCNKALEALDHAGRERAGPILGSLCRPLAGAERMEESSAWRHPVDLVALHEEATGELEAAVETGRERTGWEATPSFRDGLLEEAPSVIVDSLLEALREGCEPVRLAREVAHAACRRIARFPTSNEFRDWDTALHTFTFAHAVARLLERLPRATCLLRGVLDAALRVHLDRFLNRPAVPVPSTTPGRGDAGEDPAPLLGDLLDLLDRRQQVDEAGELVGEYLALGGAPGELEATLGKALLRENRNFHTIQCVEATVAHREAMGDDPDAGVAPVAAARYLAAHAATTRSQEQTFTIARRLHRGEALHEKA